MGTKYMGKANNTQINEHKQSLKACPNGKCLTIKHDQTLFGHQTFFRLDTLFDRV